jgi:hypothetical protein
VDAPTTNDIVLEYIDHNGAAERTLHVSIVDSKRAEGFTLQGGVGPGEFVVSGQDVFMYVDVVGILPGDRPAGAHYLLRVGESPLVWERLPNPAGIADDTQIRHITLGPDGHIYLMVTDHDGVRIYRRP